MFHSARITLTLWYILIACIITAFFSLLAYNGLKFEFERGLQKQQILMETRSLLKRPFPPRHVDSELQEELRERLLLSILYIDLAVILAAAGGGYILAGRTLRPIKDMVDEQNRFITDASHELRTPLTVIRTEMEANLLTERLTDKEAKSLIESNLEEIINLQHLTDSLLTLSQHQRKNLTKTSVLPLIQTAITKTKPLAKIGHISIKNTAKNSSILADIDSLVNVFVIILDNAIKYSPKNSIITISTQKLDHKLMINFTDQGIGIEPGDTDKIFDRFYRTDASRQRSDIGGYGLGLSIAKQIIAEHKGTISVTSEVGKGSTFSITLPIIKNN